MRDPICPARCGLMPRARPISTHVLPLALIAATWRARLIALSRSDALCFVMVIVAVILARKPLCNRVGELNFVGSVK
jgi:hypothetical protein